MAELPRRYPSSLFTNERYGKTERQNRRQTGRKKGITPSPPPSLLSPGPEPAHYRYFTWVDTSRLQSQPGSPSLLGGTLLWKTAQGPACGGICPLSSPSPFPPPSIMLSAGLSTGCSGGRGAPASGFGSLSLHTTSSCRHLGGRTVSGRLQWTHARTLVCRTWLPATLRLSLG